jgi:saccharopine dehydrogenase-like NADP-dependent oxidoreductase
MHKVLILGAGMVVKPIVTYLLDQEIKVTVATRTKSKAESMIDNHPGGTARAWTVEDEAGLDKMISEHDLTVSLLPWTYHVIVAGYCLKHKKNMVTTSYVKPAMKALDAQAREAGIIILNELGLDPGIDHMSAMRIIDNVHGRGGKIEGFYSICGALPAPEAADNPFKYKFSWSPKGVVMAGNNDGQYLREKEIVKIPTEDLFRNPLKLEFPGVGPLEVYPNRDSLPYIELYGIPETRTMVRGTFRFPGWCEILDSMKKLRLISDEKSNFTGMSYSEFMAYMINEGSTTDIGNKVAHSLGIRPDSLPVRALEWLGLFADAPMNRGVDSPFEIVSDLMIEKMMLGHNERDMVAMQHIFLASFPGGSKEVIKSTMLDFGTPATDTSIARTVALPAAIGVEMILNNRISARGVHIPVIPEIYNPILDRLEEMEIKMAEEYGLPENSYIDPA